MNLPEKYYGTDQLKMQVEKIARRHITAQDAGFRYGHKKGMSYDTPYTYQHKLLTHIIKHFANVDNFYELKKFSTSFFSTQ